MVSKLSKTKIVFFLALRRNYFTYLVLGYLVPLSACVGTIEFVFKDFVLKHDSDLVFEMHKNVIKDNLQ